MIDLIVLIANLLNNCGERAFYVGGVLELRICLKVTVDIQAYVNNVYLYTCLQLLYLTFLLVLLTYLGYSRG